MEGVLAFRSASSLVNVLGTYYRGWGEGKEREEVLQKKTNIVVCPLHRRYRRSAMHWVALESWRPFDGERFCSFILVFEVSYSEWCGPDYVLK
jgi:hypothetical protein